MAPRSVTGSGTLSRQDTGLIVRRAADRCNRFQLEDGLARGRASSRAVLDRGETVAVGGAYRERAGEDPKSAARGSRGPRRGPSRRTGALRGRRDARCRCQRRRCSPARRRHGPRDLGRGSHHPSTARAVARSSGEHFPFRSAFTRPASCPCSCGDTHHAAVQSSRPSWLGRWLRGSCQL